MGLLRDREFTELEKRQMITTGRMIDTLERGQIAECLTGFYEGSKVIRTDLDEIVFTDCMDFLKMTTFAHSSKWILKKRKKNKLKTNPAIDRIIPGEAGSREGRNQHG